MVSTDDVNCAGCERTITDRYYLFAIDRKWHLQCLKCCLCKEQLQSQTSCFSKDGRIYCKYDYYRLISIKTCARCKAGIFANELVMRAKDLVFHLSCFTCYWCNNVLNQGDYFGLKEDSVYCQPHYELMIKEDLSFQLTATKKWKVKKKKTKDTKDDYDCIESSDFCLNGPVFERKENEKPKRRRTSFKHHQLRTMKNYFSLNQNPDSKDLKQLAQKTGLTKRVLQVWFQNARAKWRRINKKVIKRDKDSQEF